ncbi:hypothetical protein ACIA8O_04985 [Kitasatospora sp. NPDC051853]|uniref:hypothetical protein n=1 Tax=Kitasatospora sp. NPDC051853 TaxID=3364058 RepID=UPI0037AB541C
MCSVLIALVLFVVLGCAVVAVPAFGLAMVITIPGELRVPPRALLLLLATVLQGVAWAVALRGNFLALAATVLAVCTTLVVGAARLWKLTDPAPPVPAWYPAAPNRY